MPKQSRLFKLADEDKVKLGDELAGVIIKVGQLEIEKADVTKDFKDRIDALYERAGKLAATLSGSEPQEEAAVGE